MGEHCKKDSETNRQGEEVSAAVKEPVQPHSNSLPMADSRIFVQRPMGTLPQAYSPRPFIPDLFHPEVSARLSTPSDSVRILKTFEGGEFQIGNFSGSLLS